VRAFRRQVTLAGEVGSDAARQVAVRTARETSGVGGVKDELRLGGSSSRDEPGGGGRDADAVRKALRGNSSVGELGIEVATEKGRLVLRGRVRTGAEKDLAGLLARDAAGGPVENALQIHP
jgi:osmotically-inducible protein OsmY